MNGIPGEIPEPKPRRRRLAGVIALLALALAIGALAYVLSRPLTIRHEIGLPHGLIVAAGCTFVVAVVAQIRAMSLGDVFDMLFAVIGGVFAAIGAVLKGIWNAFLALIGWD